MNLSLKLVLAANCCKSMFFAKLADNGRKSAKSALNMLFIKKEEVYILDSLMLLTNQSTFTILYSFYRSISYRMAMGDYKSCSLHGKPFPANLIDLDQHDVAQLFLEQSQIVEGKKLKLQLYIGKSDKEGMDMCTGCMTEKILSVLKAMGIPFSWKHTVWNETQVAKKDGSGTYTKRESTGKTIEEMTEIIKAEKAKKGQ